jgi:glycosyltransferase involved in cell wall biosynthesis
MPLTVLINAGPWVPVPPPGYGGIENVLATLIPELRARGTRVWLCAVGSSTLEVDRFIPSFEQGMLEHITGPYNQMMGIAHAHMQHVVEVLEHARGAVDLVHDHLEVVGPSTLAAMGTRSAPALQTLHWDLRKHPDFYGSFDGRGRVFFNGVSEPQVRTAPANVRRQTVAAIPLATPVDATPFQPVKGEDFLVLARFTDFKGQDVAARICREHGWRCDLAGPVAGLPDLEALERALADGAGGPDVRYFLERVQPLLDGELVRWIGSVTGAPKLERLGRARALLCPISWEEPGATNVVEAFACGTPVIGMRRGALPALIEHGVTGYLADDETEFAGYMARAGEIDPAACRRAAEERFGAGRMAEAYLDAYAQVIARSNRARPGSRAGGGRRAPAAAGVPAQPV